MVRSGTACKNRRVSRLRVLLSATLLLGATVVAVGPAPSAGAAGDPPLCTFVNDNYRRCNHYPTAAPLGSIALLGDSVMLGSADGMSSPGLPKMLADAGWGPLNLVATLGMRTYDSRPSQRDASAWHWIDRWQQAGWKPSVVAVNLGANHLTACTPTDPAPCRTAILTLIDKIGPSTTVWWAKVNQQLLPYGAFSSGMLGWNLALDQVAAARPNLVVWDWPTALATADPPISMDVGRIHPTSGVQYVKRSRMMADDITSRLGAARLAGPVVDPPVAADEPMEYLPATIERIVTPATDAGARLAAGSVFTLDLAARAPAGAQAVALTLGSDNPTAGGFLTAYACDEPVPWTSNLNFAAGQRRASQVLVGLSAAGTVCILSPVATSLVVDLQGWFVPSGGTRLRPIDPQRLLDTRSTGRAAVHRISVLGVPGGSTASAVALSLVALESDTPASLTVWSCDDPQPEAVQIYFAPGETIAGAVFAPVSTAGTVCVTTSAPASVVVDITGLFSAGGDGLRFTRAQVKRMLDTRSGLGGWVGRHGANQTLWLRPAPPGALAVSGTITMVQPEFSAWQRANPCGGTTPVASAVNAPAGAVLANSITVGLSPDQRLCLFSLARSHTLFDVSGWWW